MYNLSGNEYRVYDLPVKIYSVYKLPRKERKRPKCGLNLLFWANVQIYLSLHVLDLFSGQRDRIEMISFALSQASSETSLDYPKGAFWRHYISLEGTWLKIFRQKNTSPMDLILKVSRQDE